jgi:hypothetical protein
MSDLDCSEMAEAHHGNTCNDLQRAYEIELDRIEQSIGKKLTQEVYDNELFKINEDDFYTITFIRQALDAALEETCSLEVDDTQYGYCLFIGGKCYGIFDTMILAQAASSALLGDSNNTFMVPIFSSIIPLMRADEQEQEQEKEKENCDEDSQ